MSDSTYLLGLDLCTTRVKALLVTTDGTIGVSAVSQEAPEVGDTG
ncbi:MAG: hypothetical protein V5A87_06015 [Candidatus Bipolaricaulota bacterium]